MLHSEIQDVSGSGNAPAEHNVKLRFLKRRRHLVLHDFDAGAVTDHFSARLQGLRPADIEAHRSVKFQRAAAGRRLRISKHDPDLFPELIDEDHDAPGLAHGSRQLAERLAHEPGLKPDMGIAHLSVDLSLRRQCGD